MSDRGRDVTPAQPWLTIVGIGEDGRSGLSASALAALDRAEFIMGSARHLALLGEHKGEARQWPVPFADGLELLLEQRGRRVVALASGDPFWFGAGSSITQQLSPQEWMAYPVASSFSLAAARLGWPVQATKCLALHAAPLDQLRPYLSPGTRILLLLRDGGAVAEAATYLTHTGFGESMLHVLEALGGPRERLRQARAKSYDFEDVAHPVALGINCAGTGAALPRTSGIADHWFDHDGQLTKQPVRALTLSALAPRAGELLWDIGAGSGSIGIEWLLAHPANCAFAVEAEPARAARAVANAARLGVDRLEMIVGRAPDLLPAGHPDAIFIGGGLSEALLQALWPRLPSGGRLVANAVTLESETLLAQWHEAKGGQLLRIDLAHAEPLGSRRSWRPSLPLVQWSVTL